jgi:hypothetical protein
MLVSRDDLIVSWRPTHDSFSESVTPIPTASRLVSRLMMNPGRESHNGSHTTARTVERTDEM